MTLSLNPHNSRIKTKILSKSLKTERVMFRIVLLRRVITYPNTLRVYAMSQSHNLNSLSTIANSTYCMNGNARFGTFYKHLLP